MQRNRVVIWPVRRVLDWALSFPMFIKILGIGVLAVGLFAVLALLWIQTTATGGLRGVLSQDLLERQVAEWTRLVFLGLAPCLLVAAGLAALLAHLVTRPIERLVQAAHRIGEGDFEARAEAICDDEIGHLAEAFNRMAERLAEYRRQVEQHERVRGRLIERIVDSQEEERKRISRELHDEVGQSLMALLLWVQGECRSEASADFCPMLETRIRGLAEEIHRLARGMRPSILDDYGLDSALGSYLDEVSRKSGLEIDYQSHFPEKAERLADRLELTLYRIVQEAMTNVLRHARASRVSVVILRQHEDVTLLVEDDGCGFDPVTVQPSAECRLGLTGIRERAALFGGDCTVESEPGRGTTVRVKIPLREEELCLSAS